MTIVLGAWQPIETAPKREGFLAIVYCPGNHQSERIMMAEYRGGLTGYWEIHIDGQALEPTHWMPLPEPPEA